MNSWLVVSNMSFIFHFIYEWDVILPIDFHIFQDGWNHQPGKKMAISFRCMISDIMHVLILNNQVSCYWPGFLRKWRGNSPLTKTGCGWFSPSRSLVCTSVDARWCPSSIAKLVNITPISLWFMVDITNELMGVINQLITGGHHIVSSVPSQFLSCFFPIFSRWHFILSILGAEKHGGHDIISNLYAQYHIISNFIMVIVLQTYSIYTNLLEYFVSKTSKNWLNGTCSGQVHLCW